MQEELEEVQDEVQRPVEEVEDVQDEVQEEFEEVSQDDS